MTAPNLNKPVLDCQANPENVEFVKGVLRFCHHRLIYYEEKVKCVAQLLDFSISDHGFTAHIKPVRTFNSLHPWYHPLKDWRFGCNWEGIEFYGTFISCSNYIYWMFCFDHDLIRRLLDYSSEKPFDRTKIDGMISDYRRKMFYKPELH